MRAIVVSPLVAILIWVMDFQLPLGDPTRLGIFLLSLVGAWFLLFFTMVLIGSLAMYVDSALSVFEIWLGIHFVLSGYLVPIELLPAWAVELTYALPFWYTLGFPVETAVGLLDVPTALRALGIQWLYLAGMAFAAMAVWRAGMRRFVAFGG
jgi:ABC-2 type transport system permease protein